MINYKTLGISFSIPSGVAIVGGGVQSAPKCWQPRYCTGLGPVRKYNIGFKPKSEMESPPE